MNNKLFALAFIFIMGCQNKNTEGLSMNPSELAVSIEIIEADALADVKINRIFAHYENKSEGCVKGGELFGPATYPTKVVPIGSGLFASAPTLIDTDSACPLELAGFSAEIQNVKPVVNGGFSIDSANANGVYIVDCYMGSMPPGYCLIAAKNGERAGVKSQKGWFARVQFTVK